MSKDEKYSSLRKNPLREEDYMNVPDQKEPLFPRSVLQPLYEEWKHSHATGDSAAQFYNFLLRQSKPDSEVMSEELKLFQRLTHLNTEELLFGRWLGENGWQPYDGMDRWINIQRYKIVESIVNLYADYKKENPEP